MSALPHDFQQYASPLPDQLSRIRPGAGRHPKDLPTDAGTSSATDTMVLSTPRMAPSSVADSVLLLLCDQLNDAEQSRIAAENRLRSLTETWERDGTSYGKGVSKALPEVAVLTNHVEGLQALEHGLTLAVKRAVRVHPLGPWIKQTVGVGEKQCARLLAAIGDPAARHTVSQLWAYCGLHVLHPGQGIEDAQRCTAGVDPSSGTAHRGHASHTTPGGVAPSRKRGQKANWNSDAKMRVYLVAESCIKQRRSPYRAVYDDGRVKYADAVHNHPCPRCGPAGKPAPVGSPLSLGHQHARAMRLVMKALLKDLWRAAHVAGDTHTSIGSPSQVEREAAS